MPPIRLPGVNQQDGRQRGHREQVARQCGTYQPVPYWQQVRWEILGQQASDGAAQRRVNQQATHDRGGYEKRTGEHCGGPMQREGYGSRPVGTYSGRHARYYQEDKRTYQGDTAYQRD